MRRKDREMDSAFALEVLRDCEYATLATTNPDGTPYCIPLSHVVVGNAIYFHCANEGHKLVNIKFTDSVCISGVRRTSLVPEKFTTEYESAVATGRCSVVTDDEEKIMALIKICEKYAKGYIDHAEAEIAKMLHRTCVCRIDIRHITGKANKG